MIKKTKIFSMVFSTTVLLPFNLLSVSCGKKVIGLDTNSKSLTNENEKQEISQEIKDFIKSKLYLQGDKSILVIDQLLEDENFDKAAKPAEISRIIDDLDQLDTDLNNSENNKIELKNTIIMQGLKKAILDNCIDVEKELKKQDNFTAEFQQVSGQILEIDENSLIFNLKKFSINQLLHDIKDENLNFDNEQETKIAKSKDLKIYNFSTILNVNVNKGNGKKDSISIRDLNLFVVLDKAQSQMLTEGITGYLQKRVEQDVVIYLDGTSLEGKQDKETSNYFSEILKKPDSYDLTSRSNKQKIMFYLSNVYLPSLIYKNYSQNEEKPVNIESKELNMDPKNLNLLYEGMEMNNQLRKEISFLNFFGNQKQRQISPETVEKITVARFLKNTSVYDDKYYILGSGTLKINHWSIRGFSINPINLKFKIYIMKQILETEIINLKICLNNLLDIMSESIVIKFDSKEFKLDGKPFKTEEDDQTYTIYISPFQSKEIYEEIKEKFKNKNKVFFDDILNALYMKQAITRSQTDVESLDDDSCKFSVKTVNESIFAFKPPKNSKELQKYISSGGIPGKVIDIDFVFNSSFKIKLNNDLLVEMKKAQEIAKPSNVRYIVHIIELKLKDN